VAFGNLRGTGEGTEASDASVPQPTGHDGDELIADEAGIVLVTLDDLAANQFSSDGLEEVRPDAGLRQRSVAGRRIGEFGNGDGTGLPQRAKVREDATGFGKFSVGEVVGGQLPVVQQLDHFVVEAAGAIRFDEGA